MHRTVRAIDSAHGGEGDPKGKGSVVERKEKSAGRAGGRDRETRGTGREVKGGGVSITVGDKPCRGRCPKKKVSYRWRGIDLRQAISCDCLYGDRGT